MEQNRIAVLIKSKPALPVCSLIFHFTLSIFHLKNIPSDQDYNSIESFQ